MSFKDEYHPKVKRDIKKLDREVIQEIFSIHMEKILQAPYKGYRLHGELEGIFTYHFVKKKVSYRIAYSIDEDNRIVYVLMIAKREGFYEILKRRCS